MFGISGAYKIDYKGRCSYSVYSVYSVCIQQKNNFIVDAQLRKKANALLIDSRLVWSIGSFFYVVFFFTLFSLNIFEWYSLLFRFIHSFFTIKQKVRRVQTAEREKHTWKQIFISIWMQWHTVKGECIWNTTHKRPFVFVLSYFIIVSVCVCCRQFNTNRVKVILYHFFLRFFNMKTFTASRKPQQTLLIYVSLTPKTYTFIAMHCLIFCRYFISDS